MKTRDSGMPQEELWQTFFDPQRTLTKLGLTADCSCVVDFGCGFGTFSIPAAKMVQGTVYAVDIDPEMVAATRSTAEKFGLSNLQVGQRDFVEEGCGLASRSADCVFLFNILHAEEAQLLLAEAKRVLTESGTLFAMHWNYDARTPRGPGMDIRQRPEQCQAIVEAAGFNVGPLIDLPPYHYGFAARPVRKRKRSAGPHR